MSSIPVVRTFFVKKKRKRKRRKPHLRVKIGLCGEKILNLSNIKMMLRGSLTSDKNKWDSSCWKVPPVHTLCVWVGETSDSTQKRFKKDKNLRSRWKKSADKGSHPPRGESEGCLLYTSDAADDSLRVCSRVWGSWKWTETDSICSCSFSFFFHKESASDRNRTHD